GDWDVSNVTNMGNIFMDAKNFNQDIGNWIVSDVSQMDQMFKSAVSFNQDIGNWNTTKVTNMGGMFRDATSFNQDVSKWDVSMVTNMQFMFDSSDFSLDNYDKLLTAWSQLTLKQAVVFTLGAVNYCNGAEARESMITTYKWLITDGGLDCSNLGNEDEHLSNISIYPNPTRDKLFIQGLPNPLKVSIYNVLGKLVLAEITSKDIDVKQLSKGIYILKIIDEQKETVRKFIKN
ncbi:MAG: BspA family leucine-rich repeat surface protein, partial [Polaribacter sp.]|nr:BspA family leucine-rich repeat surface protein [Polaribacter sp.]